MQGRVGWSEREECAVQWRGELLRERYSTVDIPRIEL